jgi:hypothetical protein
VRRAKLLKNERWTRRPFGYASDGCVERGVSAGYSAAALAETERAVMELVSQSKP